MSPETLEQAGDVLVIFQHSKCCFKTNDTPPQGPMLGRQKSYYMHD